MLKGLEVWQRRLNFKVELIDIDQDKVLTDRFAARIPLLMAGDTEICEYHLDEGALLNFFKEKS
jgi:thioredoxin reductase (NADPH)